MRLPALLAVISATFLAACDNPEQNANALFVEAAQALTTAHAAGDPAEQYDQLTAARQTVTALVTSYSGSSAAVRISANEKIGPYSLADLNAAIAALALRPELCLRAITRSCFTNMVLGNLDTLLKHDRTKQPDESLILAGLGGLPYANIVAPDKVQAIFAASPDGIKANAELLEQMFGFPPAMPQLLRMLGSAKGEKAVADAVTALNAVPGFQDLMLKNIGRVAYTFLRPRQPDSGRLIRAAAKAVMDPLPKEAQVELDKEVCKLTLKQTESVFILADCTTAELAMYGDYFSQISPEILTSIYEAAPPEKKPDIASYLFSRAKTLDDQIAWKERTKYANDFQTLTAFYLRATREGHRARAALIGKLENAVEKALDNPGLTKMGLSPKTVLLHHANGTLKSQLPAIYQIIETQRYSYQLYSTMANLAQLQPLTPGMDQMTYFRLIGKTVALWPKDQSAHIDALRGHALAQYPADLDPRPAYDALYAGTPYARKISYETLMRFKAHGHTDIFDAAVAASASEEEVQSLRFQLARNDVLDQVRNGDIAAALTKLAALPFITRYYIIGHSMQDNDLLPQEARDTFRKTLLETYPYELTAFELGWKHDLGVPMQMKLDTVAANYAKLTEFIGESPADWLMQSFGTFTPEQRAQALKAMHQGNDKLWPLYASAIALVNE